jgi:hypothetical protein
VPDVSRQRRSLSYKGEKFMNNSTLDVETTSLSETSGTNHPATRHHIPEVRGPQITNVSKQNSQENIWANDGTLK